MALSPNAPDYVSQVRGFLSDLRQDARQRDQLALEAARSSAANALNYAQLAQQRELAYLQADLNREQYQQAYDQKKLAYENDALKNAIQTMDKQKTQELAERRFQFDVIKEAEEQKRLEEKDRKERIEQTESRFALQKLGDIMATGDLNGFDKWVSGMSQMAFSYADLGNIYSQGLNLWNSADNARKEKLTTENMPTYISLTDESSKLGAQLPFMTSQQRLAAIGDWEKRSADFKVRVGNPQMTSSLDLIAKGLRDKSEVVSKDTKTQSLATFTQFGKAKAIAEVSPELQKEFDTLYTGTSSEQKLSEDYQSKLDLVRLAYNKEKSKRILAEEAARLRQYEEIQVGREGLYTTDEQGFRKPKLQAPDLSPSLGSGNLDENNEITELAKDKIKNYESRLGQQGILLEKLSPEQAVVKMMEDLERIRRGEKIATPESKPTVQVDTSKVRYGNTWAFPTAVAPQATTAAAPTAPQVQPAAPAQPSANLGNLEANKALFAEVQKQIAGGKKFFEVTDPKTGEVRVTTYPLSTLFANLPALIREQEKTLVTTPTAPEDRR